MKNPPWNRDELILALNLYMKEKEAIFLTPPPI